MAKQIDEKCIVTHVISLDGIGQFSWLQHQAPRYMVVLSSFINLVLDMCMAQSFIFILNLVPELPVEPTRINWRDAKR